MTDDKIRLGVLWKNVTREGNKPYLSGRVQREHLDAAVELLRDGGRLLVLSNTKRPDKQDPDCVLFVVPDAPRRDGTDERGVPPPGRVPPRGRARPRPSGPGIAPAAVTRGVWTGAPCATLTHMERIGIRALQQHASAVLRRVRR